MKIYNKTLLVEIPNTFFYIFLLHVQVNNLIYYKWSKLTQYFNF